MKTAVLILAMMVTSCVGLRTVSLTQVPKKRSKKVVASVEKWVFLGFNFDNDYVDTLTVKLSDQCQRGQIKGILSKYETTLYFIVAKHTITARGFCV